VYFNDRCTITVRWVADPASTVASDVVQLLLEHASHLGFPLVAFTPDSDPPASALTAAKFAPVPGSDKATAWCLHTAPSDRGCLARRDRVMAVQKFNALRARLGSDHPRPPWTTTASRPDGLPDVSMRPAPFTGLSHMLAFLCWPVVPAALFSQTASAQWARGDFDQARRTARLVWWVLPAGVAVSTAFFAVVATVAP
jgi:hypothetical protein